MNEAYDTMGVPFNGPSLVQGDKMSVILNSSRPQSTLTKKSNSIFYHAVREAVAMDEFMVGNISTHDKYSDILTKMTHGGKRVKLASGVIWYFYDSSVYQPRSSHLDWIKLEGTV